MAIPPLIVQADLELAIGGAEYLVRFTDDDRDGDADVAVVAALLEEANALAVGLLKPGFPSAAAVETLVSNDPSARRAICDIACGMAGDRRHDFASPDGRAPFSFRRQQGEKTLRDIAVAAQRSAGEEQVGRNQILRHRVSSTLEQAPKTFPRHSRDRRGPGGF